MPRLPLAASAAFLLIVSVPSASAATYCVSPESSCPGGATYATVQQGLNQAALVGDSDVLLLGAATYTAPTTAGFTYNAPGKVEIVGKGATTVLTAPSAATRVLAITQTGAGSLVRDLKVRVPASVPAGAVGVHTLAGLLRVELTEDQPQSAQHTGVFLNTGADMSKSKIAVDNSGAVATTGVVTVGTSELLDSDITGRFGLVLGVGGATADRVRITARTMGMELGFDATVRDCLVRLGPAAETGISVYDGNGSTITGCTIVGPSNNDSAGISVTNFNEPAGVHAVVSGVVISGFGHSVQRYTDPGKTADLNISFSDFDPSSVNLTGAGTFTQGIGNGFHADPRFVDAAAGDYRPRADSPLVDVGNPDGTGLGVLDLSGLARIVDGDGNLDARPDIGAFEYQRQLPTASVDGPSTGQAGQALTFTATGEADDANEAMSFAWSVDGAAPVSGAVVTHTFTTVGTHHVVLTASDVQGGSVTVDRAVEVAPAPVVAAPPVPVADVTPAADVRAPILGRLRVAGRRLRVTVDEQSRLRVRIYRVGRAKALRTRTRAVAAPGAVSVPLGTLRPGRYRVTVVATDAAGNRSVLKAKRFRRR
jgi:hypothetical protein